jgi:hypothetical protein
VVVDGSQGLHATCTQHLKSIAIVPQAEADGILALNFRSLSQ